MSEQDNNGKERSLPTSGEVIKLRTSGDQDEYDRAVDELRILKASNAGFTDAEYENTSDPIGGNRPLVTDTSHVVDRKIPEHLRHTDIRYQMQVATKELERPKREVKRLASLLKAA